MLGASMVEEAIALGYTVHALSFAHRLVGANAQSIRIDLANKKEINSISDLHFDWLIHCAAYTKLDDCEHNQDYAMKVNVEASGILSALARRKSARFLYISTDSVFDGTRGDYREDDRANPLNVYARSKYLGEQSVRKANPSAIIVRTNIFGWNVQRRKSLVEWILSELEAGNTVNGFTDVFFNPTFVADLSLLAFNMCESDARGLYHVAGSESCSKFEFAKRIAALFGYDESKVKAAFLADAGFTANRPLNTTLDCSKATSLLGRPPPSLDEGLTRLFEQNRKERCIYVKDTHRHG